MYISDEEYSRFMRQQLELEDLRRDFVECRQQVIELQELANDIHYAYLQMKERSLSRR